MSQRRLLASYWSLIAGALCTDVRSKRIITYLFITFTFLYIIMQQIIFTCETVTPMFLAGADGSTPELRPPSIKGALRFWWRALNGHLSIEELKKREGAIFGDTTQRSKVIIRVKETNKITTSNHSKWNEAINYLSYGVTTKEKVRDFITPTYSFEIKLVIDDTAIIDQVLQAAKTFFYFGGLGFKSRNGFGSLHLKDVSLNGKVLTIDFEKDLQAIINKHRSCSNLPKYHAFSKESQLFVTMEKDSWQDALCEFADIYKNNRTPPNTVGVKWTNRNGRFAKSYFFHVQKCGEKYKAIMLALPYDCPQKKSIQDELKVFKKPGIALRLFS